MAENVADILLECRSGHDVASTVQYSSENALTESQSVDKVGTNAHFDSLKGITHFRCSVFGGAMETGLKRVSRIGMEMTPSTLTLVA